jgi:PAS domain S-box-containing protein
MALKLSRAIDPRPSQIVQFATDAIISKDRAGMITSWNRGAERLYGYRPDEAIGEPISLIIPDGRRGEEWDLLLRVLGGEHIEFYETARRAKDGRIVDVSLTLFALRNIDGHIVGAASIAHDITRQVAAEHARRDLEVRHHQILQSADEGIWYVDREAVTEYVNPSMAAALGYTAGQMIGRPVADFLSEEQVLIARGIMERQSRGAKERTEVSLLRADGTECPVIVSVNVVRDDAGARTGYLAIVSDVTRQREIETELHRTESLLDSERRAASEEAQRELEQMSWIGRLSDAMDEDRLVVAAQPVVSLASGEVTGRELLVRMRNRDGDLVLPGKFLPAAERYGLIGELDRWMITRAARLAAAGQRVNVNLSAQSLGDPQLRAHVERSISDAGADPRRITFEITETALTEHLSLASDFTARMAELGCEFALDDFGTGYGAFTYLKTLPITYLKIDIEFVRDLLQSKASEHLVSATVQLAQGFGQLTVAEGVEDGATLERLRELGVDYVQGFYVGRPEVITAERPHEVAVPAAVANAPVASRPAV